MRTIGIILLILLINFSNRTFAQKIESSSETLAKTDLSFDDFILQFGFDPDFQKSRIKFPLEYINLGIKTSFTLDSWIIDRLYVELESITEVSNGLKNSEKSNERVFSWINIRSGGSKNYYFKKIKEQWFLLKIEVLKDYRDRTKEDFYTFLGNFCRDSIFQKERIKFPLDLICLDDDYKEVQEKRNQERWRFDSFYYNCDSLSNLYFDFQRTFMDTDKRILIIKGVENGISARYTFKRIDNKWVMIKYEDYST